MNQIDTETQGKVRGTRSSESPTKLRSATSLVGFATPQFPRGETVGLRITSA